MPSNKRVPEQYRPKPPQDVVIRPRRNKPRTFVALVPAPIFKRARESCDDDWTRLWDQVLGRNKYARVIRCWRSRSYDDGTMVVEFKR